MLAQIISKAREIDQKIITQLDNLLLPISSATFVQEVLIKQYLFPFGEWFSEPVICYGIAAFVTVVLGIFCFSLFLDFLGELDCMQPYMIVYSDKENRRDMVAKTRKNRSRWEQFKDLLMQVFGPTNNVVNSFVSYYLMNYLCGKPTPLPNSLGAVIFDWIKLIFIDDFFVWFFHMIQHRFECLWAEGSTSLIGHHYHHCIPTPSGVSTASFTSTDASMMATLPVTIAMVAVRGHPIAFLSYLLLRTCTNAHNHSGIDHPLLNFVLLRFLPFRSSPMLHDSHHRFSGYGPSSKNFAEQLWFWDFVFGTYYVPESRLKRSTTTATTAQKSTKKQK